MAAIMIIMDKLCVTSFPGLHPHHVGKCVCVGGGGGGGGGGVLENESSVVILRGFCGCVDNTQNMLDHGWWESIRTWPYPALVFKA